MSGWFSGRIADGNLLNVWARRRRLRDADGPPYLDLTVSNPTAAGLPPGEGALPPLGGSGAAVYRPTPRGLPAARAAVARDLRRHGAEVHADRVLLTSSTSEAYGFLFKLLCAPGDEVLVPAPGYPLFDHLAHLEAVEPVTYVLEPGAGWFLDLHMLQARIGPRTRALVLVSPHNPTGWRLPESQRRELAALAAEARLAVICDEVFADFCREPGDLGSGGPPAAPVLSARADTGLWFTLGGLSKSAGLPQMKVSWVVVGGDQGLRRTALERLETLADMVLSVSTPAQLALPAWLHGAGEFRQAAIRRLRDNGNALQSALAATPECELLPSAGGWSAVLRLPATRSDEVDALALLDDHDVLVQPGYLFDLSRGTYLVLSLLVEPEVLAAGLPRLTAYLKTR